MKILLLTDNHTPIGGAESYFFDLKQRLKNKPDLQIYSIGFGPEEKQGLDYFVLKSLKSNMTKLFWRICFHPMVYLKLRKKIKQFKPDVIHIHNIKQYTPTILKAIESYPVVQTVHDFSVICPTAQNIHKDQQPCPTGFRKTCFWDHQIKYNRLVYLAQLYAFFKLRKGLQKQVNTFIAPSPLLVDYLRKNEFSSAIYVPPFKKECKTYSFDKLKPKQFLFAGNLGTHKGVHLLLEEFALACMKDANLKLLIAGTGPETARMQKSIAKYDLEKNVILLGWQKKMDTLFEESLAVIFPSIGMESFGLTMTDAMSHARPIIGCKRGTTNWLVDHNQTGLLFDPLQRGDLAAKLLLFANHVELAKKMGINGFEKLQKLIDNDTALEKIIAAYQSAVTQ